MIQIQYKLFLAFVRDLYAKVNENNFTYLALVTGQHRAGKSFFSILMSLLLDETFEDNMDKRIVYDAKSFMNACKEIEEKKIFGAAIVWDEAGVGLSSRDWYDISNKSINYAIQVIGYLHPLIFFVTQDASFLDAQPKKLLTNFFEIERKNNEYSSAKVFNIEINRRTAKIYYKFPRVLLNNKLITIKRLYYPRLPREVAKRYEEISFSWKQKIIESMQSRVSEIKTDEKIKSFDEIKQEIIENFDFFKNRKHLDYELVATKYAIPRSKAKLLCKEIESEYNEKE